MSDTPQKGIDITQLAEYVNKIEELSSVSKMMAPVYLRDYILGQDVAANLLAKAIQADSKAKAKLEQAEAIAFLEKAKEYLESKSIKDTSEARKQYVNMDPDVLTAKDNRAKTEALVVLLKSKLNQLRQCHDDLKKIIYDKSTDTAWEGM
jgi:DNA polymerase II small subunit/DNA polymerase delta subunit B